MAEVEPDDVVALLADRPDTVELAVPLITTMAKAYTRGRGFDGNEPNETWPPSSRPRPPG